MSEDSNVAAEEDAACGSGPADASSDKEGAKSARRPVFVEPDDLRELEQDVQWMDTPREQAKNDPRTRETLVQLLALAGSGAKAINGFDADLAEAIKVDFRSYVLCCSQYAVGTISTQMVVARQWLPANMFPGARVTSAVPEKVSGMSDGR